MPRHPDGAVARNERVTVRLDHEDKALLELKRGSETASDYLRGLIRTAPTRKDTPHAPID